jgi:hypothetical protein
MSAKKPVFATTLSAAKVLVDALYVKAASEPMVFAAVP